MKLVSSSIGYCSDCRVQFDRPDLGVTGLPTEVALKVMVEKMGVPDDKARKKIRGLQIMANYLIDNNSVKLGCCDWWTKRSKRVGTLELDRIRMSMSVIVREPGGHNRLLVKGAVESVLDCSSHVQLADGCVVEMDKSCRQLLLSRHVEMSSKGLRCLGLAYKDDAAGGNQKWKAFRNN
ncbi:calcium-transporting ATPase, endoplasmic reticulum-type-like isoform X2 [Helianthus annuus]|uniref:calcium-transporting ATPase, endoplasmic reticulum-type-like isoform X2 n=1 Tax=Helianthus annuus TaxID=4232 RepID=UPI001652C1CC|nr:calcium-transporting ATPase, endoplasmic reticulum-type-like isoform X2 [Helianthus annuus]